jgi:hypothetical protein
MAEPDIAIQHAPIKQAITRRLGIILPITEGDVPIPASDTSRLSRVQVQRENFHSGFAGATRRGAEVPAEAARAVLVAFDHANLQSTTVMRARCPPRAQPISRLALLRFSEPGE